MTEDSAVKDFLEILEVRWGAGIDGEWTWGNISAFVGTIATNRPALSDQYQHVRREGLQIVRRQRTVYAKLCSGEL